jgi:nicotinamide phosphoribosyltransferase
MNGKGVDVQKNPVELDIHGDLVTSFKKSKAGQLKLIRTNNGYATTRIEEQPNAADQLVTVFENGKVMNEVSFEQVRERAAMREEMVYA